METAPQSFKSWFTSHVNMAASKSNRVLAWKAREKLKCISHGGFAGISEII